MKTAVALCFLAIFGASFCKSSEVSHLAITTYQQRIFEGLINDTINSLVDVVAKYDPLHINHQELNLIGHHGEVHNVNAEGFSNIVASRIKLSGLITWTLELVIDVPKASGSVGRWQVDGDKLYGEGSASVLVENLKVSIVAKINPVAGSVKDVRIKPSIGNAQVSVTGIYNDEELSQRVSDAINHFLNDTLNNNTNLHDKIGKMLKGVLEKLLEVILG